MDLTRPTYPRPTVVVIEANIGAGKSTVLEALRKRFGDSNPRVVFVPEPVDAWEERGFLAAMYHKTIPTATFQMMVLVNLSTGLFAALSQYPPPALVILERSVWGNRHTFAEINLTADDMRIFDYAWESLVNVPPLVDLDVRFVHLRASVDTVMERMRSRGRESEAMVERAYLQKLADAHDAWFAKPDVFRVVVDADGTQEKVFEDVCAIMTDWALEASERFDREQLVFERGAQKQLLVRTREMRALGEAAYDAAMLLGLESTSPIKRRASRPVAFASTEVRFFDRAIVLVATTILVVIVVFIYYMDALIDLVTVASSRYTLHKPVADAGCALP